jgi:hypothetical protein
MSIDIVIKKGILAGLFSLDYGLDQTVQQHGIITSSDSSTISAESSWQSEYVKQKQNWREEMVSRHSSLGDGMPAETATGISSVGLISDSRPSNPSGLNSLPPSPFSAHLARVAQHWTLDINQQTAFYIVAQHANRADPEQLKMFLLGHAGSGKSQVIKALCSFFTDRNESHCFRLTAFMGIAANNIDGVTLHAALNLNPRTNSLSKMSKSKHELHCMWTSVDYLFIDKVSMISCEFLQCISDTLIVATGCAEPFGGINVIFAGDMGQLPPVAKTRLTMFFRESQDALSASSQLRMRGRALWLSIDMVIILQGNNRQSGDHNACFRLLLDRLRRGNCNDDDYDLLSSRIIPRCMTPHALNSFLTAPIIVCDNEHKDVLNERFTR